MTEPEVPVTPVPLAASPSVLGFDDRSLSYDELVAAKPQLVESELIRRLADGRAMVRANAALGLAALGHTGRALIPFLRDGDPLVAEAAAAALVHLGLAQRANLVAIAAALDGAKPQIAETVAKMFAELVGKADPDLVNVLDTGAEVVATSVVRACGQAGLRGLHLLQEAARDDRTRVRINALRGIAQIGELEQASSMDVMNDVEREDRVSDVRAAARQALGTLAARCRAIVATRHRTAEPAPPAVPELEKRALTPAELTAASGVAPLDELLRALDSTRVHVRLNAARVLGLKGPAAAPAAGSLAMLLKDPDPGVRVDVAAALGKIGPGAVVAAGALVRALGDAEAAVIAAVEAALAGLGEAAQAALMIGLEAPTEAHGARVAAAIGRLADGPRLLREALASSSADVRVHAALGLGALGKARAGAGLRALATATTDKNARVRDAVAKAVAILEPKYERSAPAISLEGFEDRILAEDVLAKAKAAVTAAGVGDFALHLNDARPAVRANAALALGTLGGDALALAPVIAVCLRDDAPEVRLAAARALDRLGDAAVAACATDVVKALRDADPALVTQLSQMLKTRASLAIDEALLNGLDTTDARHGDRICAIVSTRPAAVEILCDAFARPRAQANAARGFALLGKARVGRGRALLEAARGSAAVPERELAQATLREIDGVPAVPQVPAIASFETALLDASAFTGAKLDPAALLSFLQDGRWVVRSNTATAFGSLGAAGAGYATTIGALLRDDDDRVRIAAANALDKLGDDAVLATAAQLVGALKGSARVSDVVKAVLGARKAKVEGALVDGLETSDEPQGLRVAELIGALPNARELLFIAFDSPAQNVQINAALGIGLLGAKRAGPEGRRKLTGGLAGPFTRRRDAMVKALSLLGPE